MVIYMHSYVYDSTTQLNCRQNNYRHFFLVDAFPKSKFLAEAIWHYSK